MVVSISTASIFYFIATIYNASLYFSCAFFFGVNVVTCEKKTLKKRKEKIHVQQLVASSFAKNRENVHGELWLNEIISFSIIVCCLVVA